MHDNAAEDSDDKQMDDKIWRAIANWCQKSETDGLDGFKYWYEFCQKLDNDPTIDAIMTSVQAYREVNEALSFKEALDLALKKRKYLIYETLKKFKTEGIWKVSLEEPENGLDLFKLLKNIF